MTTGFGPRSVGFWLDAWLAGSRDDTNMVGFRVGGGNQIVVATVAEDMAICQYSVAEDMASWNGLAGEHWRRRGRWGHRVGRLMGPHATCGTHGAHDLSPQPSDTFGISGVVGETTEVGGAPRCR